MRRVSRRIGTLLILGGLSAFGPLSTDLYLPGLPALTRDLNAAVPAGQTTLTSCLIGMGVGQLMAGPVSDARGRRVPLLLALALYVAASIACAVAPSMAALTLLRFVQGGAGGAGMVIAMAVVRDLYSVVASARAFALLLLVAGVAPMLAPTVGALLLQFTSWRGIFVALAAIGGGLLLCAGLGLGETLPVERRRERGLTATLRVMKALLSDRSFVPYAGIVGFAFGGAFSYIAASPFVFENVYDLSPPMYGAVFALNSACFVGAAQASGHLVRRVGPDRLVRTGVIVGAAGATCVLLAITADLGLAAVLAGLAMLMAGNGLVMPSATALALSGQGETAGSASALLGLARFAFAAGVAPLVGVDGAHSAGPMGVMVAGLSSAALVVYMVSTFRRAKAPY
jgi:DHA1 family bicyclomycin/chloramphenicol resistance-like MFS transporter